MLLWESLLLQFTTFKRSTLLDAHWCSCHIKLSVQLGKHKMTYENLAPPSQVQEKTYQLPGNGHTSVLVLTSSGHKHGTVIHILSAASSSWMCPMLRIISTSSLLICNLFYRGISIYIYIYIYIYITSSAFVKLYDLYFIGWNTFVTLFIRALHKVHTHILLWEVYFVCKLTAVLLLNGFD